MKKLMTILVIAAALITVSCKKETVKLAGTKWEASVSVVDGFHGEYLMTFVSDSTGMLDESVMEGDEVDVETFLFSYSFDGKEHGTLKIETDDDIEHFSYSKSSGKPTITIQLSDEEMQEMGFSSLVFHQQ
ncbi:MAG: hypothetical protein IKG88_01390 [Bacteroidales bacterium]|nr:hypothetical protein [Bacteroidales bacterium]